MSPTPVRLAVLASGSGTNLQSILDYFDALGPDLGVNVVLVASNRADAFALERARRHGIATAVIEDPADGESLAGLLHSHGVDLVALAGYLRLVPAEVTRDWRGAIVNVHPALLPRFGGPGMYGRHVHQAVLDAGERESGVTVHLVNDEFDGGEILAQDRVAVEAGDTARSLAARVLEREHQLYPRTLHALALGLARKD